MFYKLSIENISKKLGFALCGGEFFSLLDEGAPTRPSSSTPVITTTSLHSRPGSPDSLRYIPVAVVTVIFLHIIMAVVYCTTRKKGSATVNYSRGDGDGTVSLQ
ncbi:hypothetical protein Q7C36_011030 [Tachysurus vachellii]|uniref:Uncharacterized protein n=1 Tax=Tachysurus vachellii TaxID=175792 RepID=A0AA88MZD1_TACVA|nr:hypothetical protein Q7C36_011030 [Tachysurus vachellii]